MCRCIGRNQSKANEDKNREAPRARLEKMKSQLEDVSKWTSLAAQIN